MSTFNDPSLFCLVLLVLLLSSFVCSQCLLSWPRYPGTVGVLMTISWSHESSNLWDVNIHSEATWGIIRNKYYIISNITYIILNIIRSVWSVIWRHSRSVIWRHPFWDCHEDKLRISLHEKHKILNIRLYLQYSDTNSQSEILRFFRCHIWCKHF